MLHLARFVADREDFGIAYNSNEKRIFIANRNGTMTIVKQYDVDHYSVEQHLPTEEYAKTIALDPMTNGSSHRPDLPWSQEESAKERRMKSAAAVPIPLRLGTVAQAGPPYTTDDPEAPDPGKWELYWFVEGDRSSDGTAGAVGFDINYGATEDLQFTVAVPVGFDHNDTTRSAVADVEVAVKYRFLHQTEGSWVPDVAFYPSIGLPTGAQRFGSGEVTAFISLWAQKDVGDWSMFGGGGYTVDPGDENKNAWVYGLALSRQVTSQLNLGGEIYHQTADEIGGKTATGVGFGVIYAFDDRWALMASVGPHLTHRRETGDYSFYVSLAFAN